MPRKFIQQFGPTDKIDQTFLAAQKQLRPNKNGNLYLQVELSDRPGSVSGRMWNAGDREYNSVDDSFSPNRTFGTLNVSLGHGPCWGRLVS